MTLFANYPIVDYEHTFARGVGWSARTGQTFSMTNFHQLDSHFVLTLMRSIAMSKWEHISGKSFVSNLIVWCQI